MVAGLPEDAREAFIKKVFMSPDSTDILMGTWDSVIPGIAFDADPWLEIKRPNPERLLDEEKRRVYYADALMIGGMPSVLKALKELEEELEGSS